MPIDAITCIYFIGSQWFFLSWISNSFICSCVRVLGVIALMISSKSFGLFSRNISCLSFDCSCFSDAFSYASFIFDSEDLSNFFLMDNYFCHIRPRFFGNGWKNMHVPGIEKCVDRFVTFLGK